MTRLRSLAVGCSCVALLAAAVAFGTSQQKPSPAEAPKPEVAVPQFWKGNLHTHSLWSDGDDFPEMIAEWYKTHGYHFLTLSDHNVLSDGERWIPSQTTAVRKKALEKYTARFGDAWVERRAVKDVPQVRLKPLREFRSVLEEPKKFLLIPGEEVTHSFTKRPIHMNAINLRDLIKPVDGPTAEEAIRVNMKAIYDQQKKTGWPGIVFLNHPNFGWGVRAEDLFAIEELKYFEVFNGHPGVRNYGDATHAGTERIWDILLAVRLGSLKLPIVYGVATDDAHGYHEFGAGKVNPGRGWIMVRAKHLTAEALVKAMHTGDFYFSSGVALKDVGLREGELKLEIAAEEGVEYTTEFFATMEGTKIEATPVKDDEGKELDVTKRYSADIGKVVGTVKGKDAAYTFTGKELYVRAKVTSTKPHPNPYQKGDVECAWTQPYVLAK